MENGCRAVAKHGTEAEGEEGVACKVFDKENIFFS
jgi:hypothetical protein